MILALINLIVIGLVLYWLYKRNEALKRHFFIAATLKLLSGIGIGLLYKYYYTFGDTWAFFNIAEELNKVAEVNFGDYLEYLIGINDDAFSSIYNNQPRALFFVKILSVVNLMTGGNYWISSLYFSLFAFIGSWFTVSTFLKYYSEYRGAVIFSFFYFPSAVFWSSGIIKESLALGCIFIIAGIVLISYKQWKLNISQAIAFLVSMLVLWYLKYYYAGVIMLLVFALFITTFFTRKLDKLASRSFAQITLFFSLIIVATLVVTQLHPNFYPHRMLGVIVDNYQAFVNISEPGDFVEFGSLETNAWSFIYYTPKALISGLFRPFIGESLEPFKIITGLENLLLVVLFIYSLMKLPKFMDNNSRLLILTAILFIVILAVFLTISSPNYGTLIRYKTGFLPFFVLMITFRNHWVNKLFS